jgi:hypothetical protein
MDFAAYTLIRAVHTFVIYGLWHPIFVLVYQTAFPFICNFIQKMSLISTVKQAI